MPPLSEKSRWGDGAAPAPPVPVARKFSPRDLLAIVAGAAAIAGLGYAAWQAGDDREGVLLSKDGGARGDAELGAAGDGLVAEQGTTPPVTKADPALVAESAEDQARMTQAFTSVLKPAMRDGAIAGYVLGSGPAPAIFARAGVQPGDMIVFINGRGLQSPEMVAQLSEELAGSKVAEFVVERGGITQTLTAKIQD